MASSAPTGNALVCSLSSSAGTASSSSGPAKTASVACRRDQGGSLVFQAARLLGPPMRFEASKLKVIFVGGEEHSNESRCAFPRTYALAHCDFTANLTLAVSSNINIDQWRRWQTKIQKDDVVAEWKRVKDEMSLHVHCYVSGANLLQELAAEFRYYIFSKELPLVLSAVVHGDSAFFSDHPELLDAKVWVYFHSSATKFNRLECWGPLIEATQRTLDDRRDDLRSSSMETKLAWPSPKTILHALVAFFL